MPATAGRPLERLLVAEPVEVDVSRRLNAAFGAALAAVDRLAHRDVPLDRNTGDEAQRPVAAGRTDAGVHAAGTNLVSPTLTELGLLFSGGLVLLAAAAGRFVLHLFRRRTRPAALVAIATAVGALGLSVLLVGRERFSLRSRAVAAVVVAAGGLLVALWLWRSYQITGTFPGLDLLPADFSYRKMDQNLERAKRPVRQLARLLEPLSEQYDIVLLDSPPVVPVSDPLHYLDAVDGCIYMVMAGQTPKDLSKRGVEILRSAGANILGAVANNLGVKGVGEPPIIPTAGAVAGALWAYDGIRRNRLPMSDAPAAAPSVPKSRR